MLHGVTDGLFVATSAPLPTALGMLDFVNNTYVYNSISYTLGQTVNQTAWRDANGLNVPGTGTGGAALLIADLQTKLATCLFAMVIECNILNASGFANLYTQSNAGEAFFFEYSYASEWYAETNDGNPPHPFAEDLVHSLTTGIHKFAVSRNSDTSLMISVDGHTPVEDTTEDNFPVIGFPMTLFTLGGYSDFSADAVIIRSVSVYDPVSNLDLVLLSA